MKTSILSIFALFALASTSPQGDAPTSVIRDETSSAGEKFEIPGFGNLPIPGLPGLPGLTGIPGLFGAADASSDISVLTKCTAFDQGKTCVLGGLTGFFVTGQCSLLEIPMLGGFACLPGGILVGDHND